MEASGMEVNKEKSCTFVFNTLESVKSHLIRTLGFRHGELPTKYLGNQIDIHPTRMVNWQQVIEKLKNKMASWSFRSLNIAGRIVLVKSVLQAIPIYSLSIMATPKGACTKIKEIYGKFIWGGPNQQRKWALVSWKHLTKRKEEGGLGLRDPEVLNRVMGAKLWWRWMRGGNDLWKNIWTHKYNMPKTTEEILRLEETPKGSTIWNLASQNRSINIQQKVLREGRKYVKDYWKEGETDGIWRKWSKPEEWVENINQEQQKEYLKEVESRKIKVRNGEDILRWGKTMKGTFSVKEAYYLTGSQERAEENIEWKIIWDGKWWPKIALFAWLVGKERILTWDKIQKRGLNDPSKCSLCNQENETQDHILNNCGYATQIWEETRKLYGKEKRDPRDIKSTIFQWSKEKFNCKVVKRAWDLTVGFMIWLL
eukprot:PITA_22943